MYVQGSQEGGFSAPTSTPKLNLQNLSAYFSQTGRSLPQFEGIDLPQAPPPVPVLADDLFNPFGNNQNANQATNKDDDNFGDFGDFNGGAQAAQPVNSVADLLGGDIGNTEKTMMTPRTEANALNDLLTMSVPVSTPGDQPQKKVDLAA